MNHASLFSGIGGFDLAAEIVGWINIFHCENNSFCQHILKYYWPNALAYDDIKTTDFTRHQGQIDILTGGFPCQPFSQAGRRRGATDDRYLWPQMLRAIREIRPTWVVAENVTGITSMVFPSQVTKMERQTTADGEEIHRTLEAETVIHRICEDLEAEGYQVIPVIIPACGVGAIHRRDRVWFVAHTNGQRGQDGTNLQRERSFSGDEVGQFRENQCAGEPGNDGAGTESRAGVTSHPNGQGLEGDGRQRIQENAERAWCFSPSISTREDSATFSKLPDQLGDLRERWARVDETYSESKHYQNPTESPICGGADGFSHKLDGITFSRLRKESLIGYGNAVVVPLVVELFKMIEEVEKATNKSTT